MVCCKDPLVTFFDTMRFFLTIQMTCCLQGSFHGTILQQNHFIMRSFWSSVTTSWMDSKKNLSSTQCCYRMTDVTGKLQMHLPNNLYIQLRVKCQYELKGKTIYKKKKGDSSMIFNQEKKKIIKALELLYLSQTQIINEKYLYYTLFT